MPGALNRRLRIAAAGIARTASNSRCQSARRASPSWRGRRRPRPSGTGAIAHMREASIAVNEQAKIRTVQELADQLSRIEQIQADLRAQQAPDEESSTSIHV